MRYSSLVSSLDLTWEIGSNTKLYSLCLPPEPTLPTMHHLLFLLIYRAQVKNIMITISRDDKIAEILTKLLSCGLKGIRFLLCSSIVNMSLHKVQHAAISLSSTLIIFRQYGMHKQSFAHLMGYLLPPFPSPASNPPLHYIHSS